MTEPTLPRTSKLRRSRLVKMLGLPLIGITLLGLTAPLIIARTGLRDRLINAIVASPNLSVSSAQASLGWMTPASIDDLTVEGAEKRFQLKIARVETEHAWPQLLASNPNIGKIIVDSPRVRLDLPVRSAANVDVPIAPIFDAQIRDAALTVRHQDLDEPILDVRGLDVDLHARRAGDTTVLSVDPVSLFSQEPITPEHCSEILQLINPSLQHATHVDGVFSLRIEKLSVPIGVSSQQMIDEFEAEGELNLQQVSIDSDSPLLKTLSRLVSEMHGKQAPAKTRIVKNAAVKFQVHDGRLHHDGLRFGFPEIDPNLEIHAHGSLGFDQSLDLYFEIPRLDLDKNRERGPIACHVVGTIQSPVVHVKDASLVIHTPDSGAVLLDVDGVDFSARLEQSDQGRLLTVDPTQLLDREKLDRQLAGTLLQLVEPELQYAPQLDGEVSLWIDKFRIPLDSDQATRLTGLELSGRMVIHEANSLAQTPIRQAVVKLLADMYGQQPSEVVRVAHNAEINFQFRDGRLHFDGLRAGFPDIDPTLEVTSHGSIGVDESLDVHLKVPRFDPEKQRERGPVLCHLTGTVQDPLLSAKDASLVVRLPDRSEPLIDVDGVDLTVRIDERNGRLALSVDPTELLHREQISRQLASGLLHLVDPELQYAPHLVGEVSLSTDVLRVPVGIPDENWMSALEAHGKLTIHQASSLSQSPLRMALAKLLGDLYAIHPGESIRLVHDAEVEFTLSQSRLQFQGLQFGFPDIDPELQISAEGSIGLDQTLDLHLLLPRLDSTKRNTKGQIDCRITGTVKNPQLSVKDASLVVRLPGHEHPLLDIDSVDLKMQIQYEADIPVLMLDPVKVFDHHTLSSERSSEWLRLIAPTLANLTDVKGQFSLTIDRIKTPLSGSAQDLLRSTELNGELQLHQITTRVESPLLMAMLKVLADQYGQQPAEETPVVKDANVRFELRGGRLYHEGLNFGFPDLSDDLVCRSSGSVGLDGSLDLLLEAPSILTGASKEDSETVRFKVSGTIDEPLVVELEK